MEGASSDCHLAIAKSFEVDCIESGEIQVYMFGIKIKYAILNAPFSGY